jgi:hypothetical protein
MRRANIPRQLLVLMLVSAGVTVATSVVSYALLQQSGREASRVTASSLANLERSYAVLEN